MLYRPAVSPNVVVHETVSFSLLLPGNCLLTYLSLQQMAQYLSADPEHSFARGHVVFFAGPIPFEEIDPPALGYYP